RVVLDVDPLRRPVDPGGVEAGNGSEGAMDPGFARAAAHALHLEGQRGVAGGRRRHGGIQGERPRSPTTHPPPPCPPHAPYRIRRLRLFGAGGVSMVGCRRSAPDYQLPRRTRCPARTTPPVAPRRPGPPAARRPIPPPAAAARKTAAAADRTRPVSRRDCRP